MKLVLSLLSLLLLEQDLVLVVQLRLRQALVALLSHIVQPLLEADLLGVVEPLELGQLMLRVLVNLIDRSLELFLFFF